MPVSNVLEIKNKLPLRELYNVTCHLHDNCMVVLGGESSSNHLWTNEIQVFDLVLHQLRVFRFDSGVMKPFDSHASIFLPHKEQAIIFGGNRASLQSEGDDIFVVDLKDLKCWTIKSGNERLENVNEVSPDPKPTGRKHHSAIYDPKKNQLVSFGGMKDDPNSAKKVVLQDCWGLDLETYKWTQLHSPKRMLYGHSCVYDSKLHRMIVFGGCNHVGEYENDTLVFDLTLKEWRQLECQGKIPPGRERHVAHFIPEMNEMIIYGGWSLGGSKSDLYSLDLDTLIWKRLHWKNEYVRETRFGHGSVYFNGALYVYGGKNDFFHAVDNIEMIQIHENTTTVKPSKLFQRYAKEPYLYFVDEKARQQYLEEHEERFGNTPSSTEKEKKNIQSSRRK